MSSLASSEGAARAGEVRGFLGESLDFRVDRGLAEALRGLFAHDLTAQRRDPTTRGGSRGCNAPDGDDDASDENADDADGGSGGGSASTPLCYTLETSADLLRAFDRGEALGTGTGGLSRDALACFFATLAAPRPLEPYPLAAAYPTASTSTTTKAVASSGASAASTDSAGSSASVPPPSPPPLAKTLDALSAKMIRFRCTAVGEDLVCRALVAALLEIIVLDHSLLDFDVWCADDEGNDEGDLDDLDLPFTPPAQALAPAAVPLVEVVVVVVVAEVVGRVLVVGRRR